MTVQRVIQYSPTRLGFVCPRRPVNLSSAPHMVSIKRPQQTRFFTHRIGSYVLHTNDHKSGFWRTNRGVAYVVWCSQQDRKCAPGGHGAGDAGSLDGLQEAGGTGQGFVFPPLLFSLLPETRIMILIICGATKMKRHKALQPANQKREFFPLSLFRWRLRITRKLRIR